MKTTSAQSPVNADRIEVSGKTDMLIAFSFLGIYFLCGAYLQYVIYNTSGIGTGLLISFIVYAAGFLLLLRMIRNSIAKVYVRAGMVVVKYISGRSRVTDIRAVKNVNSHTFLGFCITNMEFSIDGRNNHVLMFRIPNQSTNPEKTLQSLRGVA